MVNRVMFHYYIEPKVIPDLLTEDEIEYIKKESINKFNPSTIDRGGKHVNDESVRKSETAWLSTEDPIIRSVVRRCVGLTNKPFENAEKLQVLRYTEGGHYQLHQDVIKTMDNNKRLYTIMIALNDDYEGGETIFPLLNKSYKLSKGDAIFFHTLDNYNFITSKALHGGKPVESGDKWICNLWVRKYPYA
jgi:predicted 2-oxoglutarate/Fe(II)-dependent dioxygenase YbiX